MTELGIVKLHEKLLNKEITSADLIKESLDKAKSLQEKCNAFVTILDDAKPNEVTDSLLSGIPFGAKDNYSTKGVLTTGSSNTLKDYVPFFDATAIANLKKSGAVLASKTTLDEFGMGTAGITAHTGVIKNPWDPERICGGSSSGSAASVAAGVYPFAIGSDTGDSIRKPAAFCGVVGYKPTYGMISRYGLLPYVSSMDHCGALARSVEDVAIVVDAMKGIDPNDQTSWDSSDIHLYKSLNGNVKGKKLFYIKEIISEDNYPNIRDDIKKLLDNFHKTIDGLRKKGVIIEEVSIDKELLNTINSIYACITNAEAISNMSNLTGIIFGPRGKGNTIEDIMMNHRTNGFSPLIKRRFIIGSYVLQKENQEKYFLNAQRVRRLLVDKFKELFKMYDGFILPTMGGIAPLISDAKEQIKGDEYELLSAHLEIGDFGGFPSITIPSGFINKMPIGICITGNCYDDANILNMAYALESTMNYKGMIVGDKYE